MKIVVAFVVCLAVFGTSFAQNAPRMKAPDQDQLLIRTGIPSPGPVPFPANASFVTINTTIFDEVAAERRHLDRIEDFPMPDGSQVTLLLEEFDVLTRSSKIVAGTAHGDKIVEAPAYILLRGTIEGNTASHVYLSVFRNYCIGYIQENADADRILITPAVAVAEGSQMPHVIYYQYDVDPKFRTTTWHCGAEDLPANQEALARVGKEIVASVKSKSQTPQATTVRNIAIAVECDNDFYKDLGSVMAEAQKYAIAVLGAMSDIYARDANCAVKASFLRVWSVEDPYTATNTNELLAQFQNADINADRATALLFSGTDALGGGLAYLDVLCIGDGRGYAVCGMNNNPLTYPTDKYVWDTDVTSHEFGHNVGAVHTHNCDWSPPIDSCVASEGGCYNTPKPRKGTVMSYCHLTTSGTELKIHTKVGNFMKTKFIQSGCTEIVPVPVAKAPADMLSCRGAANTLTGTGTGGTQIAGPQPYAYLWFPSKGTITTGLDTNTLRTVIATPVQTTSYVFRITDANNVRAYDTVIVTVDTVEVKMGPRYIEVCGIDSLTIAPESYRGIGTVTFEWRENESDKLVATGHTVKLQATDTMMYKIIATDSIGCTGTDVVTIHPLPAPNATITTPSGTTTFCDNTVELDAGSGFTSYSWSTGASTRKISVNASGTYSCIVKKGGSDCADTASITLTKNPAPAKPKIAYEDNILKCPVTATAYRWYKQTNPTATATTVGYEQNFTPQINGYYHVKITNEVGCEVRSDTLFVIDAVGGVNDEPASTVRVYPNPASKSVTIDAGTGPALSNLYITDIAGKTVWSAPRMSDQTQTIVISKWANGSYVLHFTSEGNPSSAKFVKE